jgi:hypothetical protein
MTASRIATCAFATTAYLYAFITTTLFFTFMMPPSLTGHFPDVLVLYSMHRPATVAVQIAPAWAFDCLLMALFCLPHSFFAMDATKNLMNLPKVNALHDRRCVATVACVLQRCACSI